MKKLDDFCKIETQHIHFILTCKIWNQTNLSSLIIYTKLIFWKILILYIHPSFPIKFPLEVPKSIYLLIFWCLSNLFFYGSRKRNSFMSLVHTWQSSGLAPSSELRNHSRGFKGPYGLSNIELRSALCTLTPYRMYYLFIPGRNVKFLILFSKFI